MRSYRVLHVVIAEDFGRHGDRSPEGPQGLIFAEACDAKTETCICASKCLRHAGEVLQWYVPVVLRAVLSHIMCVVSNHS